ncbi:hypothetical protein Moror_3697 [Moniliophthora roreri MCA 2997]|uniref:Uncharacterized protein n=1 Tax=Moniliophthora roreri (strain MCA 2997) TaxID=1381753 RepID=V2WLT8_MONRO|nr:hypothetical protein Moror_3697 [Moniliophthora roreri MCA 2997]
MVRPDPMDEYSPGACSHLQVSTIIIRPLPLTVSMIKLFEPISTAAVLLVKPVNSLPGTTCATRLETRWQARGRARSLCQG